MRLIDADALLKRISSDELTWYVYKNHGVQKMITESPTVDTVPVIRCKDCYWYGIVELKNDGTENRRYKPSWCFFWNAGMNEVDFCSLAERKEHETN